MLGKRLEQLTIDCILAGQRVHLFDLDKAPTLVFAEMMQQRGFHVELISHIEQHPTIQDELLS